MWMLPIFSFTEFQSMIALMDPRTLALTHTRLPAYQIPFRIITKSPPWYPSTKKKMLANSIKHYAFFVFFSLVGFVANGTVVVVPFSYVCTNTVQQHTKMSCSIKSNSRISSEQTTMLESIRCLVLVRRKRFLALKIILMVDH